MGSFHESAAISSLYFFTHPSAPHSLKISIGLFRFSLAFDRSPLEWKQLSDRGQKKDYFNSWK